MSAARTSDHLLAGTLPLSFTDLGGGSLVLLLHGGAGPASMGAFGAALSATHRVVTPVHLGFDCEPRPDWVRSIGDLATGYLALIERLDLADVVIVGNSAGGWIAAEMALRRSPRLAGIVLLNAVGIDADPHAKPIVNRMAVSPPEPARFAVMPPTPEAMERLSRNQQALLVYAGEPFMHDPDLRGRLATLDLPVLVAWGYERRDRRSRLWPPLRRQHSTGSLRADRRGKPFPADREARRGAPTGGGVRGRTPFSQAVARCQVADDATVPEGWLKTRSD